MGEIVSPHDQAAFEARGVSKRFGHIEAVVDVSVAFHRGQITAVVGDNGAGKSTLVKMLTGALRPDDGEILLNGETVVFHDPLDARQKGVEVVYQELALAPNLDVTANVFLGRELRRGGLFGFNRLAKKQMVESARRELSGLSINLPGLTGDELGSMSGGQRQCVAVARAAYWASSVVLMDEPTSALGLRESRAVLDLVKRIRDSGLAVGIISHALPHVAELADHLVVLRHGRKVSDLRHEDFSVPQIMQLILEGNPAATVGQDP